jgi:hypothetical protein
LLEVAKYIRRCLLIAILGLVYSYTLMQAASTTYKVKVRLNAQP